MHQAWLTHDFGKGDPEFRQPDTGENPPFGATVYFHVPDTYDGKTPVTLQFADSQGNVVRSFALHLKTAAEKKKTATQENPAQTGEREENATAEEAENVDRSAEPSDQQIREKEEKLTAIEPGMNSFQWDLRYPNAPEVAGYHAPIAAGGLEDSVEGPLVVPGTYTATLDYGGRRMQQRFVVALDPRIHANQQDLVARLALQQQIHADLISLDKAINQAMTARDQLQKAVAAHRVSASGAGVALAALDQSITGVAQMQMKSSEGSLLHETKLRDHLAYLAADVGLAYSKPTPAQYAVFRVLDEQSKADEQELVTAIAGATRLVPGAAQERPAAPMP